MSDLNELKIAITKVPVVQLDGPTGFQAWHVSLRRLVVSLNMGDALLFTVPHKQIKSYERRKALSGESIKKEAEKKAKGEDMFSDLSPFKKIAKPIDLTEDLPLAAEPRSDEDRVLLRSMGVSSEMDDFFATSTVFRNVRTGEKEGPRQHQYRQEIWTWMDSSLSKGMYRWVTRSIPCVYDIHALYTKVFNMANKATLHLASTRI